jgi:ATP-dependent DNA helicase RecQ
VQKALSAILRTGEWFGAGHLIDILTGTRPKRSAHAAMTALPTFGVGTEFDRKGWQAVFRQMMGHDLVRPDPDRHGALRMTDAARPILKGEAGITLRKERHARQGRPPPRGQGAGVRGGRAASVRAQGQTPCAGGGRARARPMSSSPTGP